MCSNVLHEGLEYTGRRFSGTYTAAFLANGHNESSSTSQSDAGDNNTEPIAAIVVHCWNGMILHICDSIDPLVNSDVVTLCINTDKREVTGLGGSKAGAEAIVRVLGLENAETTLNDDEGLYLLQMSDLVLPEKLREHDEQNGVTFHTRFPLESELSQIVEYRIAFGIESLGQPDTEENRRVALEAVTTSHRLHRHFVIVDGNKNENTTHSNDNHAEEEKQCALYSFLGFSGVTPSCVNVGPVFTPKEYRCRGFAKRLLYGSLCYARDSLNATHATLIANDPSAVAAYLAVGFKLYGQSKFILYPTKNQV
jgi:hypothetical protein